MGHVALMRAIRNELMVWLENLKGRDHLENLDVDGQIILECIIGK
jgi:hypothetical protein